MQKDQTIHSPFLGSTIHTVTHLFNVIVDKFMCPIVAKWVNGIPQQSLIQQLVEVETII